MQTKVVRGMVVTSGRRSQAVRIMLQSMAINQEVAGLKWGTQRTALSAPHGSSCEKDPPLHTPQGWGTRRRGDVAETTSLQNASYLHGETHPRGASSGFPWLCDSRPCAGRRDCGACTRWLLPRGPHF